MHVTQSPFTITNYCDAMDRGEIIVNHNYQRNPKVWPPAARSFLIETILLGYPMPKLSLYQKTDVKTKKTIHEIVDGQQRSVTIHDFFHNKFRISRTGAIDSAAGRNYDELEDDDKHRFLSYSLSVDLFIGATPEEVREVFRRMNSYTVSLNAEEKRHATFQGEFKWFIYELTKRFDETFRNIGTFPEKQLNRMADAKLLSELVHAYLHGIQTTKANDLNKLYLENDKKFEVGPKIASRITQAIEQVVEWDALHDSVLMKPHQLYALLLAIMHRQRTIPGFNEYYEPKSKKIDSEIALTNLSNLAAAVEDPDSEPRFSDFVDAGASKTNVAEQRRTRFVWFSQALEPELL